MSKEIETNLFIWRKEMNYLLFENNEIAEMYAVINDQQMCYHPTFAPNGQFLKESVYRLEEEDKDIMIIADNNLVSPICQIVKNGKIDNVFRMQKVAMFITWSKYIRARITCGISL